MQTDTFRDAILMKAREEADKILRDAEARAKEMVAQTEEARAQKREELKKRTLNEAEQESSRILARATLQAKQQLLGEKDRIISDIVAAVKKRLAAEAADKGALTRLVEEALAAFESTEKVRLLVCRKDIETARSIIRENGTLKERIADIQEMNCLGGVIIETTNGMVSIDNTYDMRLEMLLPKMMPDVAKKMFAHI